MKFEFYETKIEKIVSAYLDNPGSSVNQIILTFESGYPSNGGLPRDYPKTTRVMPGGIIYYWQAYELAKAKALKVSQ